MNKYSAILFSIVAVGFFVSISLVKLYEKTPHQEIMELIREKEVLIDMRENARTKGTIDSVDSLNVKIDSLINNKLKQR